MDVEVNHMDCQCMRDNWEGFVNFVMYIIILQWNFWIKDTLGTI